MLNVTHPHGDYAVVPGEFRSEPRHDVTVGRHQPPSSHRVSDFMRYFEGRYRFEKLGCGGRIRRLQSFDVT